MPGSVYCFNCYGEPLGSLNVNGQNAGGAAGWQTTGSAAYTPAAIRVHRARHGDGASVPVFPNDQPTMLRIRWDSFSIQTSLDVAAVKGLSIEDDLILYIAVNQLTLMDTRGFVRLAQPVNPSPG